MNIFDNPEKTNQYDTIWNTGLEIIRKFRLVITHLKIYPLGSQVMETALVDLYNIIEQNLKIYEYLTVSQIQGVIFFQEQKLIEKDNVSKVLLNDFSNLLTKYELLTIAFKHGLTKEELLLFAQNLIIIKTITKEDFLSLFNENEKSHINIDMTVYVSMKKKDTVVHKIPNIFETNSNQDITTVLKGISEAYEIIDKITQENKKDEVQNELAQQLSGLKPSILKKLFANQLPDKIEQSLLKNKIVSRLSNDKIAEIFTDIIDCYKNINTDNSPEQTNNIKTFISRLLISPAGKEVPLKIYEELFKLGLIEKIPDETTTVKNEKAEFLHQIASLLKQDNASLLNNPIYQEFLLMIKKLCALELYDLTESLIKKLMENMNNNASAIKISTLKLVKKIFDLFIISNENETKILKIIDEKLLYILDKESNLEVYKYIVQILRKRIHQLFIKEESDVLINIIAQLDKEKTISNDPQKKILINETLEQIASDSSEIIINDLKSENPKKHELSLQVISHLGTACVNIITNAIPEIEDLRTRIILAKSLKLTGPKSVFFLMDKLNPGQSTLSLKRIIEILYVFQKTISLEQIEKMVNFPDPLIKKQIIHFLFTINTEHATNILLQFMYDADPFIQEKAILATGELKNVQAVDKLLTLIETDNLSLKETICIALGEIGDEKALPVLTALLKKEHGFIGIGKATNERLRLRIAWSLRNFNHIIAKEALLETIQKDKSNVVKQIAKESLEIIEKNTPAG